MVVGLGCRSWIFIFSSIQTLNPIPILLVVFKEIKLLEDQEFFT